MTLRQRDPRERNEKHLRYLASLPCCICGRTDVQAAHIRTASLEHGKRGLGMQEKASDSWVTPLCVSHHAEQHTMNEMAFWKKYGIDPFMLAITLKEMSSPKFKSEVFRAGDTLNGVVVTAITEYPKG